MALFVFYKGTVLWQFYLGWLLVFCPNGKRLIPYLSSIRMFRPKVCWETFLMTMSFYCSELCNTPNIHTFFLSFNVQCSKKFLTIAHCFCIICCVVVERGGAYDGQRKNSRTTHHIKQWNYNNRTGDRGGNSSRRTYRAYGNRAAYPIWTRALYQKRCMGR